MKHTRHRPRALTLWLSVTFVAILVACAGYVSVTVISDTRTGNDERAVILAKMAATQASIEAKRTIQVAITIPGATSFNAIRQDYDQPSSMWTLVNKSRSIPLDYLPASLVIPDVEARADKSEQERSVRSDVAAPLKTMFDAAKQDGHDLMVGSAYRSAALQQIYFDSYAAASGAEAANQYSAHPGQSEHQTGLAVDISTVSRNCYLDQCFTSTPDGMWLAEHAHLYGFALRYPRGKELITGYQFEPWHYRYLGIDLATALHDSGLTLDESWPYLQSALETLRDNGATLQ
jgi:zinc D-Ala-D-Ala carboxypeptidase